MQAGAGSLKVQDVKSVFTQFPVGRILFLALAEETKHAVNESFFEDRNDHPLLADGKFMEKVLPMVILEDFLEREILH